jgi:hypothetical protein
LTDEAAGEPMLEPSWDNGPKLRNWRITLEQKQEALDLQRAGKSLSAIARATGMAWSTTKLLLADEIAKNDCRPPAPHVRQLQKTLSASGSKPAVGPLPASPPDGASAHPRSATGSSKLRRQTTEPDLPDRLRDIDPASGLGLAGEIRAGRCVGLASAPTRHLLHTTELGLDNC